MKSPRRGRDSLLRSCAGQTNGGVAIGWAKSRGLPTAGPKKIRNNFPVAVGETYNRFCVVDCTKMHSAARTAGGARALDPPDPRGLAVTGGGEEGLVIGRGAKGRT